MNEDELAMLNNDPEWDAFLDMVQYEEACDQDAIAYGT
jgi:hypothetical protein